ncbi:response regulator [Azospirillum sp. TSO22-1]|uniref:response regulator n=1 Tax=Azospirillum sp. TSO22-1 TaxID=716789 RepID=UPI001FFF3FCA|nr:response regulator [Azospirillum sp. TSO22-1]
MDAMNREATKRIAQSAVGAGATGTGAIGTVVPRSDLDVFVPADLTHGVALELVEVAAEKGLWLDSIIDPSTPPHARGDAAGIQRMVRRLAERALHATDRGHIALALSAEPAGPGLCTLRFSVSDTAPPLTPEQRDTLTEPLRAYGRFGCEERPDGGNRLWFAVAVEAFDADAPPESAADRLDRLTAWARDRGGRILVVDDSATNRTIAAALLRKAGLSATLADGGAEALRLIREEAFDAVLMDVAMPEVDGLAATAAIRALPEPLAGIPIIAMTAHAFPEDRARCLSAGMDDYVAKPFQTVDLLEALARRLR